MHACVRAQPRTHHPQLTSSPRRCCLSPWSPSTGQQLLRITILIRSHLCTTRSSPVALALLLVAVEPQRGPAVGAQAARDLVAAALGLTEDEHLGAGAVFLGHLLSVCVFAWVCETEGSGVTAEDEHLEAWGMVNKGQQVSNRQRCYAHPAIAVFTHFAAVHAGAATQHTRINRSGRSSPI